MPEDVLSGDAALPEETGTYSESNRQAVEKRLERYAPPSATEVVTAPMEEEAENELQPSPYDRWRNYLPASLARPEAVDPLDILSEPLTPLPLENGGAHASSVLQAEQSTVPDSPTDSSIVSETVEETRHSPFVAEDEIRAVLERAHTPDHAPEAQDLLSLDVQAVDPLPVEPEPTEPEPAIEDAAYTSQRAFVPSFESGAASELEAQPEAEVKPEPDPTYIATDAPSLKSMSYEAAPLKTDILNTDWGEKEGLDIAPSRKLDTPDMLRWRAEMLLDEMMVGAVDSSAGEGAFARRAHPFGEAEMLDDHPRREHRADHSDQSAPAPAQASPATAEPGSRAAASDSNPGGDASDGTAARPGASRDETVVAGVRAALPPRTISRMPTPIVRHGSGVASSVPASTNGHSGASGAVDSTGHANSNGHTPNGYAEHGYSGNGNGRHSGEHTTPSSNGHIGHALDAAEYDVADDGRPSSARTDGGETPAVRPDAHPDNGRHGRQATYVAPQETETTGFVIASQQGAAQTGTSATAAASSASAAARHASPAYDAPTQATPTYASTDAARPAAVDPLDELGTSWSSMQQESTSTRAASAGSATSAGAASAVEPQQRTPTRMNSVVSAPQEDIGNRSRRVQGNPAIDERAANEQRARKLTAVEKRYPRPTTPENRTQDTAAVPAPGAHNDGFDPADQTYTSGLGPVRINPAVINSASITGAMAVGSRANSRYASLLPRATPWDLHEMEREIASLQDEMARVLPSGHESSRRAHHLLDKAQTIFRSDPLRSAEVDYYLTQVRAIVQRSRQTMQWSEMYRNQLGRYHFAWLALSLLMLVLAFAFGDQLSTWVVNLLGLNPNGMIGAYAVPAVIAMFAGSLGASVGALLNIRRYHRLNLGYFDRKYSLRGLMLPIIGLLCGLAFFAIFGSLYWAMGAASPLPLVLELLPALLAFSLGFLQESIYGTRD